MKFDDLGVPILNDTDLFDLLMQGVDISGLGALDSEEVLLYNTYSEDVLRKSSELETYHRSDLQVDEFHAIRANTWFIPDSYKEMDVHNFLLDKCKTDDERERVNLEYSMFIERNLLDVLKLMIFLVDSFRKRKCIWGVGRGSSVASYCLYLIGVHRVNSLKYDLPINEFLKEVK